MKQFTNEIREWVCAIRSHMVDDPLATIAILCAYAGDETAYEFFCESIPEDRAIRYAKVGEVMRYDDDVFFAAEICGVLEDAVPKFIRKALEDFDMWYHLLDGTDRILSEDRVAVWLTYQDSYIACGLLELWKAGELDEDNWHISFSGLLASYATSY